MADLRVTGISDELMEKIRRSAKASRRSVSDEALVLLQRSMGHMLIDPDELPVREPQRRAAAPGPTEPPSAGENADNRA